MINLNSIIWLTENQERKRSFKIYSYTNRNCDPQHALESEPNNEAH